MDFRQNVLKTVSSIPFGKVASYGQVATLAGNPRAARQVGGILRSLSVDEEQIPWWRVINKDGFLSINQNAGGIEKEIQKEKLTSEGVDVSVNYYVDMRKYRYIVY